MAQISSLTDNWIIYTCAYTCRKHRENKKKDISLYSPFISAEHLTQSESQSGALELSPKEKTG